MKVLALLFLVGFASASFYDVLDEAADEIVREFMVGMENAPSLKDALELTDIQASDEAEDDIKTELGKKLKETLDHLLQKIKDAVEHGKTVKEELMNKLKEVQEKMKDLHIDIGNKAKELMDKIKEKAKDFLKNLLEKLGLDGGKKKRSLNEVDVLLHGFDYDGLLREIKQALIEDWEQKKLHLLERNLGKEKRFLREKYEELKEYFKNLKIVLKEKPLEFGEWVKNVVSKGLEAAKDKIENIKHIAKEFKEHMKETTKKVVDEALEFLRPYKDDLGTLYDQIKEEAKKLIEKEKNEE